MADLENRVDKLDERVSSLERQVSNTMTKVDMLIGEMRERDNQRVAEIIEIRQDMKEMQKSLDAKIDGVGKHVRNLVWTSMAAIGGMVITVIYSMLKH